MKETNILIESFFTNAMMPLTATHAIRAAIGASSSVSNTALITLGMQARNVHEIGIWADRFNNAANIKTVAVNAKRVAIAHPIIPYRGMSMKFAATFTPDDAIAATREIYVAETVFASAE